MSVTGKGIVKVLKESNTTLKQLDLSKTKVKKSTLKDIQTIMDGRDEDKKRAKAQKLRESKIISLLTSSASDAMAKSLLELDMDSDGDSGMSSEEDSRRMSSTSGGASLKKSQKSAAASTASSKHSASSKNSGKGSKASTGKSHNNNRRVNRAGRGSAARASTAVRASMTARQMATMGGDLVSGVGADAKTLREQRKMRGECLNCGQKCFEKKLFKTSPLTIPHKVFEGRCLKCNPM